MSTQTMGAPASPLTRANELFALQKSFAPSLALSNARQRKERILKIWHFLEQEKHFLELAHALQLDFRKSPFEVWATEIGIVKQAVETTRRQLRSWMMDEYVPGSIALSGLSAYIRYEPKGVCLILSPWNYPLNLTMIPLISAIAAGNAVILKPSELTPNTSAFMARMIGELFPPEEVSVIEGDAAVAQALLELPFDHIFFTGSPAIGKLVMEAAAKNLASVTLELGGKSPVILDESADIAYHAEKLIWAKLMNNGQTCIAPDYVLVHQSKLDTLIAELRIALRKLYGENPQQSPDLARIIHLRHFQRISRLLEDALNKGATIAIGGKTTENELYIEPTVLTNVDESMLIMQEEIFGPVLPVMTFDKREEVVDTIRRKPKPLDLYIGSRQKSNIDYFLRNTSAGNTVINEYMISLSNPELPFGGVNHSGIGKSGGRAGFLEFSNARSVMHRKALFGALKLIQPPFSDAKMKLLRFLYKLL
jgi:aldehyde dehydrogenase (NAD+)